MKSTSEVSLIGHKLYGALLLGEEFVFLDTNVIHNTQQGNWVVESNWVVEKPGWISNGSKSNSPMAIWVKPFF